tara:strand:- start:7108 stop:7809 length:702 start_codon:yes stop_codon:yes gene_type:complete
MDNNKEKLARKIYLYLAGLFITSLVVSNLIFQKFFYWYPIDIEILDNKLFELSVGILPYPITFLITDLISEIYGKKKANDVVITGIFASFFSITILLISEAVPAIENSPISDEEFKKVFSVSSIAVFASMLAYLIAQLVDIRIYHFWKKLTKGKLLWLRNNFSTFSSQFIDSSLVIGLLCFFDILSWDLFWGLVLSAFIFKVLVALFDTPFLYFFVWLFRKKFNLKINEEIKY